MMFKNVRPVSIYVFIFSAIQTLVYYLDQQQWSSIQTQQQTIEKQVWSIFLTSLDGRCRVEHFRATGGAFQLAATGPPAYCESIIQQRGGACYVFQKYSEKRHHWLVRCGAMVDQCVFDSRSNPDCWSQKTTKAPFIQKTH